MNSLAAQHSRFAIYRFFNELLFYINITIFLVLSSINWANIYIIATIYDAALADGNFIGSDIWGFFNTQAQKTCVMKGYRNVLVIITDGYIYHKDNLVEDKANKQATYITKTTLAQGYTLTPIAGKISNLEVLVVELNPDPVTDFAKMESAISDWFKAIGISRYEILKTDLPANSKKPIIDFLNPLGK